MDYQAYKQYLVTDSGILYKPEVKVEKGAQGRYSPPSVHGSEDQDPLPQLWGL